MAISGKRMARIDVLIGGVAQAKQQVAQMKDDWEQLGKVVREARRRMEESTGTVEYDKNRKEFERRLKEFESLGRILRHNQSAIKTVQDRLDDLSGQTLRNLNNARKDLTDMLRSVRPGSTRPDGEDATEYIRRQLKLVGEEIRKRQGELVGYTEAIEQAGKAGEGSFDGTIADLERLRRSLEYWKKDTNAADTVRLENIEEAFKAIERAEVKARTAGYDFDRTMRNLSSASMDELKAAASQLQAELNQAGYETEEFVRKSAQLRRVNEQIDRVNRAWKHHDNQIVATAKRLTSYVLVYTGFNEVVDRIQTMVTANLELSDSLADIQKTTGLTKEEVAELSRAIDSIDTRASQKELHDLAYEAGKLGISAEEDVLGFVRAGNQIITALGDELGGAEAVRSLMKINDLLGETGRLGVEKALLATGSAMNELSNLSTASAGPMADIVSRLGAVGAQARLSMADLIALGGTADELSQEVEVSGTALSKFVTALQTNTHSIAQAVGVDDRQLENLMEAGQTMEAIILVLRRLKGMGGLKEIDPIMKEFGSDGERLDRVVTALATNVDTLEKRVRQSREAFAEATSVTNEYNVMNESAMALMKRLGNAISEVFVNSAFVKGLEDFLRWLMDLPYWIERNRGWFEALKAVLTEILFLIAVHRWAAFSEALKMILGNVKDLAKGFRALAAAISKNPLLMMASVATAAGIAVYNFMTSVTKSMEAIDGYNAKVFAQQRALRYLVQEINSANTSEEERARLIGEMNEKYGKYLGYMLDEASSAREVSAAMDLINARMKERIALQMKQTMQENTIQKYARPRQEALSDLGRELSEIEREFDISSAKLMDIISRRIEEGIAQAARDKLGYFTDFSSGEIAYGLRKILSDMTGSEETGLKLYNRISGKVMDLIEVERDYQEEIDVTEKYLQSSLENLQGNIKESGQTMLSTLKSEYDQLSRMSSAGMDEAQAKKHNDRLIELAENYIKTGNDLMKELGASQREELKRNLDYFEGEVKRLSPDLEKELNVWGEGLTLESASVDQLVAKYKQLFKERKTMKEDADYDTVYSKQFKDRAEAMDWYMKQLQTVEKELNERGYDTNGNFLKDSKGRKYSFGGEIRSAQEIREESDAALSALEAYFNREKQLINRSFVDREITEQERNERLLKKDEEFLRDRIALRRRLLGRKGGEKFDPEKYVGEDPQTGETVEYFKGKDLDRLSGFIGQMGEAMTDGMLNKLTVDELEIAQAMVERLKNIEKIILDNDFTGQTDRQYQDQLEQLRLFWGQEEEVTVEGGRRRLTALRELSEKSYSLTVQGLKDEMAANGEFSEWIKERKDEEYQALLISLQKYHDDYEAAENRAIERRKRIADREWEKSGQEGDWQERTDRAESDVRLMQAAQGLGLGSEAMTDDAQLELYRLKVEASKAYLEQMEKEISMEVEKARINAVLADQEYQDMLDRGIDDPELNRKRIEAANAYNSALRIQEQMTLDARMRLNESMIDLENQEMEIQNRKLETLKGYTDAVVDFSAQMGEAAFSEVSDRKEAARQLLQTTMNLTKQLILQKIQELITKRMLKKQEEQIETSGDQNIMQSKGNVILSGLEASKASMGGKIQEGIAGGSAVIISELGWWGIPLIAVITAALNALMGLAMGKLTKSAQEVSSITGASSGKGRVAAGMLTYAKGDYPVLGNDGRVYNATYQRELKTGVYGGGAHFGIFSERKPEMIVDGNTTQQLILNYPHIYESILTIARHGRLSSAMPTYAAGSYPSAPASVQAGGTGGGPAPDDTRMRETLSGLQNAVAALTERLSRPISATVDPYGRKGAVNQLDKASRFMKKRGLQND